MSYVCPKDYKPCCDDLCHGSGCLRDNGYPMLQECDVCHGIIDEGQPDCGTCACGSDYDYDDETETP